MMNRKKIYLTFSALVITFGVLFLFYLLFYVPLYSKDNVKVEWKTSQMNSLAQDDFPLEINQRGPILFTLFGEMELPPQGVSGLVIPAVKGAFVEVILNDKLLVEAKFPDQFDKSNQLLFSQIEKIDQGILNQNNTIIVKYRVRDKLEIFTSPYFGDYFRLKKQINVMKFLGQDFYLITFGMATLLSLILISLGKHVENKKDSYVSIGIAMFFNAIGSFMFILNSPSFFQRLNIQHFLKLAQPISYTLFVYFLVIGIESYYNKESKNSLSPKLLFPNLIACMIIYLGFDIAQYIMSYINLSFMLFLSYNKKTTEFIFPVTVLTGSTIYLLIISLVGSLLPFPVYAISSMIIIFSFGIIMVRDFQKMYKELRSTSAELYASYEELTAMNEELESSYNELDRKVEERTFELNKTTVALKTLLDNTEEGFLTFSNNMIIDSEYSLQCETMLGKKISNRSISTIIGDEDHETVEFLDNVFSKILQEEKSYKTEMYISLLPELIVRDGKTVKLNYKKIYTESEGTKIMVILQDISEKVELQNEIENERNILKMVIKVLNAREDYLELVRDFRQFTMNGIYQICESNLENEDKIAEIFRVIHTFKGSFANFDTINAVNSLHHFESVLSSKRDDLTALPVQDLMEFFNTFDYNRWIVKDIEIIRELLGADFFSTEQKLLIEPDRIYELENKIAESELGEEGREFIIELKRLRYSSFRDLLSYYKNYTMQLAQRTGKFLNPIVIEGDDIPVDKELYKSLIRSLTHLFRNSIYHGIESPEERARKGKSEYGEITVQVYRAGEQIRLVISDDGCGIDVENVVKTALKKKFVDIESVNKLTFDEKLKLVLLDRLSTSETVSDISGRGVGLSALNHELEKFGGTVEIKTEKDVGSTFELSIPIKEAHEMPELPLGEILEMIKLEVDEYFESEEIEMQVLGKDSLIDGIELYEYNALIKISGSIYATVFLSAEKKIAKHFASKLLSDMNTHKLNERDISDAACEQCNIFVGNAMREAAKKEAVLSISSPVSIKCSNGLINYPDKKKCIYEIDTPFGRMKFGVIEK